MPDIGVDWIGELLSSATGTKTLVDYRAWNILGRASEEFVKEIFERLGYEVTLGFRKDKFVFDMLAHKDSKNLLIEVKLRLAGLGSGSNSAIQRLMQAAKEAGAEYEIYRARSAPKKCD